MMIELAGFTFRDSGRGWVFANLVDWYTLPDSKSPNDPIPQGHGSFNPGTDWRSAAALSFTAAYIGDSEAECRAAAEAFIGAAAGQGAVMRVTDALRATSREVSVRHIGEPDFFGYDSYEVQFSVDLLAWDPVRYGSIVHSTTGVPTAGGGLEYNLFNGGAGGALYYGANGNLGRVTVSNTGTQDTWPLLTITGPFADGFYIQRLDTGDMLRYDRVVPAGTTVSIDSRTGEVLIDGVSDASTYLTIDEFFPIPAMGSCEVQLNPISTGSGTLDVASAPGWW